MNQIDNLIEQYRVYCATIPTAAMSRGATSAEVEDRRLIPLDSGEVKLDEGYLRLARITDGIAADGVKIYTLIPRKVTARTGETTDRMDIVTANKHWRSVYAENSEIASFLIYGADDTALFIRHLPTGQFQHRSRTGLRVVLFDCATFEACIWEAFRYALDLGEFKKGME